jgi:hypothetical protein
MIIFLINYFFDKYSMYDTFIGDIHIYILIQRGHRELPKYKLIAVYCFSIKWNIPGYAACAKKESTQQIG